MAADKVTVMVLKVDLQCSCCYNKVKKTLSKFPQIRDQTYDEKANTVTITVSTCCAEKIRDKLYSKGGKTIKSIEIKQPEKKKEAEKPKEPEKPKQVEKPKEDEKPKSNGAPPVDKPKEAPKPGPAKVAEMKGPPVPIGVPSVFPYSTGPSYDGYNAGPYYYYGAPPPPQPCYYGQVSRSYDTYYFSEDNPQGCSIM